MSSISIPKPIIRPVPRPEPPVAGMSATLEIMNILVIVLDDLGIEQVRSFGMDTTNTYAPQPTWDMLAANGVRFTRAYSMPVCSPTRASALTGRYPFRTGIGNQALASQQPLLANETCLPLALRQATANKYRSACIGKWHLATFANGGPNHPNDAGFEYYAGAIANLERGKESFYNWKRIENGVTSTCSVYATTQNVNDALLWIRDQVQPWFLWLAFNAVHEPVHRPPTDLYDTTLYSLGKLEPEGLDDKIPYYKAMQMAVDREIGRLLANIDPSVRANTVVILTSDNGTSAGLLPNIGVPSNHNKGSVYEFGCRVPTIVSGPGVTQPGRISTDLISLTDIFRTVIDIAGGDINQVTSAGTRDSVSFWPACQDAEHAPSRSTVFIEQFSPNGKTNDPVTGPTAQGQRAIIGPRYKIVVQEVGLIGAANHMVVPYGTAPSNKVDIMVDITADPLEVAPNMLAGGYPGLGPYNGTPFDADHFLTETEWDAYQALKTAYNTLVVSP